MDFDMCKENVQPLRGGRNRAQLEVALQAQDDTELQKELLHHRKEFENAIRTYEGDDPLDNWYNYISWVEQSYPKHGHEGNLIPLLEDCLGKFENDERYVHDRRHCKLWIKYIDLQQNPDELFQLLHSKEICKSCADLYRAWAFYHEIAGDYKRANAVYQLGMQAIAQPYEELVTAQKNMFMAAGRQVVQEDDYNQQLEEQRHALTSLRTYKHKHRATVPSVRVGHQVLRLTPGSLPSASKTSTKSNKMVSVYTDGNDENNDGASAVSGTIKSVLDVAKRQDVIKENTLKPGPWTKLKPKKRTAGSNHHLTPSFKVHEDEAPIKESTETIHLYPDFISNNMDDFSDWITPICIPDPEDKTKIPMYPKHKVYSNDIETSLEEIIAEKYLAKIKLPPTIKEVKQNSSCSKNLEQDFDSLSKSEIKYSHHLESEKLLTDSLTCTKVEDISKKYIFEEACNKNADSSIKNQNELVRPRTVFSYLDPDENPDSIATSLGAKLKLEAPIGIYDDNTKDNAKELSKKVLNIASSGVKKDCFPIFEDDTSENSNNLKRTIINEESIKKQNAFQVFEDCRSVRTKNDGFVEHDINKKTPFPIFEDNVSENSNNLRKTAIITKQSFKEQSTFEDNISTKINNNLPEIIDSKKGCIKKENPIPIFEDKFEKPSFTKTNFAIKTQIPIFEDEICDNTKYISKINANTGAVKKEKHFPIFEDNEKSSKNKTKKDFPIFEDETCKSKLSKDKPKSFEIFTDDSSVTNSILKNKKSFDIFLDDSNESKTKIFEDSSFHKYSSDSSYEKIETKQKNTSKTSSFSDKTTPESSFGSFYTEEKGFLSKDGNFNLKSKKINGDMREHVRSLISRQPQDSTDVKINLSFPHQ